MLNALQKQHYMKH